MMRQDRLFEPNEPVLAPEQTLRIDKADAVEWLQSLSSESVDLVVTDPAYESLEKHRAVGSTTRLTADWFPIFHNERFTALFSELYRVLRPDTHCYVMCDQETMFHIKPIGEAAGFKFWKPIVWDKVKMGMGYHYRASCEFVLFFEKGKRPLNDNSTRDVLTIPRVKGYPTEKPVELNETLIRMSSDYHDLIVDPFSGSGSCAEAALGSLRRFAGCDIQQRAVDLCTERLSIFDGVKGGE